jgi:PHP family Zn ribbon phosphoesterase
MAWRRMDLHIHTPASADYQEPDISYLDILRKADARGADLIAFTDHNSVRGFANLWREIEDLELLEALERLSPAEARRLEEYRRLLQKIRVLPGFEFTATFGFHILAIFPEGTSIRHIEHVLLELNIPEDKVDQGSSEVGATTDVLNTYEILHEAGALVIPAHVNSTHGVAMQHLPFGGQTKIAFTQSPYIDALEATDLESTSRRATSRFFNGSKPEYPRRMHILQGSDAHRLNRDPNRESNLGVGDRMTEVLVPEASWAALADLFHSEQFNRIRPYRPAHDPYDFVRMSRSEGETIVQAFHDQIPPRRGRQSPIVRDAAAFANGNGGTIFVGLSANPTDIILGVADAPGEARAIAEDLARFVTPPVAGTIEIHTTDNKQIIVISIPPGADKPYAVLPSTIFVRQEGETAIALRDEIVQLVRVGAEASEDQLPEIVPGPSARPVAPYFTAPTDSVVVPLGLSAHDLAEDVHGDAGADASEHPAVRSSRRRRGGRGRGRGAGHGLPAEETADTVVSEATAGVGSTSASDPVDEPDASETADETIAEMEATAPTSTAHLLECEDVPYPRTGVEIVESAEREGVTYHAMRDLRNLKVVHNVTRDSARRLWRYAITQRETHDLRADEVTWADEGRGYWKAYKQRGGEQRFNLAYRHNGHLHVFYGVTDEGLDDDWRAVIPADKLPQPAHDTDGDAGGGDVEVTQPVALTVSEPVVEPVLEPAPEPVVAVVPEPTPEPVVQVAEVASPAPAQSPWAAAVAAALADATASTPSPAVEIGVVPDPVTATVEPAIIPEATPEPEPAPKPAPRRRAPRKKAEPAPETTPEAASEQPSEPAAAAAPVATAAPAPTAEPDSAPDAEAAPKPAPRRRAPRKKVEPAAEAASATEVVAEAAAPAESVSASVEPQSEASADAAPAPAPKRRRAPRKKAEPMPDDGAPADEPSAP